MPSFIFWYSLCIVTTAAELVQKVQMQWPFNTTLLISNSSTAQETKLVCVL